MSSSHTKTVVVGSETFIVPKKLKNETEEQRAIRKKAEKKVKAAEEALAAASGPPVPVSLKSSSKSKSAERKSDSGSIPESSRDKKSRKSSGALTGDKKSSEETLEEKEERRRLRKERKEREKAGIVDESSKSASRSKGKEQKPSSSSKDRKTSKEKSKSGRKNGSRKSKKDDLDDLLASDDDEDFAAIAASALNHNQGSGGGGDFDDDDDFDDDFEDDDFEDDDFEDDDFEPEEGAQIGHGATDADLEEFLADSGSEGRSPVDPDDEVSSLAAAMAAENSARRVPSARAVKAVRTATPTSPAPGSRGGVRPSTSKMPARKFVAPTRRRTNAEVAADAARWQRYNDLKDTIALDFVYHDLLDMAPQTKYDLYMASYGASNAAQASVQTNDDAADVELQTEEIETSETWTQAPDDSSFNYARLSGLESSNSTPWNDTLKAVASTGNTKDLVPDPARFTAWFRRATGIVSALLNEKAGSSAADGGHGAVEGSGAASRATPFSDTFASLSSPFPCASGLVAMAQSQSSPAVLVTAYAADYSKAQPAAGSKKDLSQDAVPLLSSIHANGGGLYAVWNLHSPSAPTAVLASTSPPACVMVGPGAGRLILAGSVDGSLAVWDLQEASGNHSQVLLDGSNSPATVRWPSYSTDGLFAYNHTGPLVQLTPIVPSLPPSSSTRSTGSGKENAGANRASGVDSAADPVTLLGTAEGGLDLDGRGREMGGSSVSFQFAALDEMGGLSVWTVTEMPNGGAVGELSELDFATGVGGRVKLVQSAAMSLASHGSDPISVVYHAVDQKRSNLGDREQGEEGAAGLGGLGLAGPPAGTPRTFSVLFPQGKPSEFIVATDAGDCFHGSRFAPAGAGTRSRLASKASGGASGVTIVPPLYHGLTPGIATTALAGSPWLPEVFVAGFGDGSIALYSTKSAWPLTRMQLVGSGEAGSAGAEMITSLAWSATRPGVFSGVDASSNVFLFDLLSKAPTTPVIQDSARRIEGTKDTSGVEAVSMTGAVDHGLGWLVLGQRKGPVVVHSLSKEWVVPGGRRKGGMSLEGEIDAVRSVVQRLISL